MAGYTKLFNSILASTIWRANDKTRIVWITLLAMSDRNGIAEGSVPGLADFARVSVKDVRKALHELSSPDEDSRSQEHDGRRIEAVEGGWRLLNHGKYRERLNVDERREYLKLKQREHRAKRKLKLSQPSVDCHSVSREIVDCHPLSPAPETCQQSPKSPTPEVQEIQQLQRNFVSTNVNNVSDKYTPSTQAEAEAEATTDKEKTQTARARPKTLIQKRRPDAAWEGPRVYVPQRIHTDFVAFRGGTLEAERELFEWYEDIDQTYAGEIDPNMFEFWRERYREKWPAKAQAPWGNWAAKGGAS